MSARLAGLSTVVVAVVGLALMFVETLRLTQGNLLGTSGLVIVVVGGVAVLVAGALDVAVVRRASPRGPVGRHEPATEPDVGGEADTDADTGG